jgi:hypothetical protein
VPTSASQARHSLSIFRLAGAGLRIGFWRRVRPWSGAAVRALGLTVASDFFLKLLFLLVSCSRITQFLLQPECSASIRFIFRWAARSWNLSARFFSARLGNPSSRSFFLPCVRSGVKYSILLPVFSFPVLSFGQSSVASGPL